MRLIDAEKLLEENKELADCDFVHPKYDDTLRNIIDNAPTVNAIVIPEGATNGDVIKAVFPNKQFVSVCSTRIYDFTTDNKIDCDLDWWNAPYGGEKR